jgi:hypothetical protein
VLKQCVTTLCYNNNVTIIGVTMTNVATMGVVALISPYNLLT